MNIDTSKPVRVAVDAMGGDFAPAEVIKGALQGARENNLDLLLVGPEAVIRNELRKHGSTGVKIEIVHTDDYVKEGEPPAIVLRQKPKASVALATALVKKGKADMAISLGSTGAVMVSAFQILGPLDGIERPVVGGPFLGYAPKTTVLDLGTNVDCKPQQLVSFAALGCVMARTLSGIVNPTVGLLSTGAEEGKGNRLVKDTYPLLKKSKLNFIGNVEGMDIVSGKVNVVLCDGFVGNILVKFCEGLGAAVREHLNRSLSGKVAPADLEAVTREIYANTNFADVHGAGPILGVDGISLVGHGRATASDVARGLATGRKWLDANIISDMKEELKRVKDLYKV